MHPWKGKYQKPLNLLKWRFGYIMVEPVPGLSKLDVSCPSSSWAAVILGFLVTVTISKGKIEGMAEWPIAAPKVIKIFNLRSQK